MVKKEKINEKVAKVLADKDIYKGSLPGKEEGFIKATEVEGETFYEEISKEDVTKIVKEDVKLKEVITESITEAEPKTPVSNKSKFDTIVKLLKTGSLVQDTSVGRLHILDYDEKTGKSNAYLGDKKMNVELKSIL